MPLPSIVKIIPSLMQPLSSFLLLLDHHEDVD